MVPNSLVPLLEDVLGACFKAKGAFLPIRLHRRSSPSENEDEDVYYHPKNLWEAFSRIRQVLR
jgi:hypothetical protein